MLLPDAADGAVDVREHALVFCIRQHTGQALELGDGALKQHLGVDPQLQQGQVVRQGTAVRVMRLDLAVGDSKKAQRNETGAGACACAGAGAGASAGAGADAGARRSASGGGRTFMS